MFLAQWQAALPEGHPCNEAAKVLLSCPNLGKDELLVARTSKAARDLEKTQNAGDQRAAEFLHWLIAMADPPRKTI